jgi:DcmR-like sensory protein
MGVRECVVPGDSISEHIVQFFDSDESRADSVARFLTEGFRNAEPAIVIARPATWAAIVDRLEAFKVPVQRVLADGRLLVKDAAATLQRICRLGSLDPELFELYMARPTEALGRGRRLRAYGEMVDLLAQRGELNEVLALENLWNELGERTPLVLMCGYSAAHFVSTATHRALRDICGAHSQVHQHAQDPLANWLLTTAQRAAGSPRGITSLST